MGTGEQVNRPASRWVKGVMRIGAVLVICLGIGLAVWDRNASAGIVIPTGILLYFMADIDRIEVFKLLGAEATMRKLDDKIDEAEAALSQIKEISEIMAEVSLTLLAKLGRWDAAPDRQMVYRLSNKIRAHLKPIEAGHLKATLPILLTRMRHFAETKKFLDLQHWFASDPARQ